MNPRWAVLFLVLVAGLSAACGVGTQRSAQLIDPHSVPRDLTAPASTTPTILQPTARVTVYFEGPNGLVPVVRDVNSPESVQTALIQLGKGPSLADGGGTLQSPVSTVTPLVLKRIQGTTAYVSVPEAFANLGGQDQIVSAAQLVYTVTALSGIEDIVLLVNGHEAQVPVSGGTLQQGPLTRADYSSLLAP